jgi:hypothetical protein
MNFFTNYYIKLFGGKNTRDSSNISLSFQYDTQKEKIDCLIKTPKYTDSTDIIDNCEKIGFFISVVTHKNNMLKNLVSEAIKELKTDDTTTLYYDNILFFWKQYDHVEFDKINEPMIPPSKVFKMYAETNDLL